MMTNKQSHERRKRRQSPSHINKKKEKRNGVRTVNILRRGIYEIPTLKVRPVRSD